MRDAMRLAAALICCVAGVALAQNPCGDCRNDAEGYCAGCLQQADTPAKKKRCVEGICKQAAQK